MKPEITVIIPTYNRADYLPLAIQSILSQTLDPFELLILDNASTDSTAQVVSSFKDSRIVYHRNKTNIGYPRNLKLGIKKAHANLVFTLSDDDIILRTDTLEHVVKTMKKYDAGFGENGLMYYDTDYNKPSFLDHIRSEEFFTPPTSDIIEQTTNWHFGFVSGHIFRKDLLLESDLIDDVWWVYFKAIYRSILKKGCVYFGNHFIVARTSVVGLISFIDMEKNKRFYLDRLFEIYNQFQKDIKKQKAFQKMRLDIVVNTLIGIRYYTSRKNVYLMSKKIVGYRKAYLYTPRFWFYLASALIIPKSILTYLRSYRIKKTIIELRGLAAEIDLTRNLKKALKNYYSAR